MNFKMRIFGTKLKEYKFKRKMENFKVFVINSAKPVTQLKEILTACGGYTYAGIIYRTNKSKSANTHARVNSKEETRKTIVFCPESTIQKLKSEHSEFSDNVEDYNWESFPVPDKLMGETWNLHISGVPNDYTDQEAANFVIQSLKCIISEIGESGRNFAVTFPPRSRETGEINGYGKIMFDKHIDLELIKHCKLVLHNTPMSYKNNPKERRMISCLWHRDPGLSQRYQSKSKAEVGVRQYRPRISSVQRAKPREIKVSTNLDLEVGADLEQKSDLERNLAPQN